MSCTGPANLDAVCVIAAYSRAFFDGPQWHSMYVRTSISTLALSMALKIKFQTSRRVIAQHALHWDCTLFNITWSRVNQN